jgi:regulator of sigma E protease
MFPGLGIGMWRPQIPAEIGEVLPEGTAAAAGLQEGDRSVLSTDGQPDGDWDEWSPIIRERPGETVEVVMERATGTRTLSLPVAAAETMAERSAGSAPRPGSLPELWDPARTEQRFGPVGAVGQAVARDVAHVGPDRDDDGPHDCSARCP